MKVEIKYPGLCRERKPSGRLRWRVRVEGEKGRKITIPVGPGEDGFDEHYRRARLGEQFKAPVVAGPNKGSLDEMCDNFLLWMDAQVAADNLSQLTLNSRRTGLRQARDFLSPKGIRIGELDADLPRQAFVAIRDSFGERTGAADTCLKALRALFKWGADYGYPQASPVFDVKSNHRSKGGAVPWTKQNKEAFLNAHGPGTMARRWFLLARDTAGRIGDTHLLGAQHLQVSNEATYLAWQPSKKGSKPVRVPLSEEFLNELQGEIVPGQPFLLTSYGKPFASSGSLDNRVRKWVKHAGLSKVSANADGSKVIKAIRSQHGLRKARAEEIAEHGGSEYEVMAALSHSEPKTSSTYTKNVRRNALAEQAIKRIHDAQNNESVPPPKKRGTHFDNSSMKTESYGGKWQPVGASHYLIGTLQLVSYLQKLRIFYFALTHLLSQGVATRRAVSHVQWWENRWERCAAAKCKKDSNAQETRYAQRRAGALYERRARWFEKLDIARYH